MRNILLLLACCLSANLCMPPVMAQEKTRITLTQPVLMHEMRNTPFPADKAVVADRKVSFQWPLSVHEQPYSEYARLQEKKSDLRYKLRYAQDPSFKKGCIEVETLWPFYNPDDDLPAGVWYWQYGYVENGETRWGSRQQVVVAGKAGKFCPPALKSVLAKVSDVHPRVYLDKADWNDFMKRNVGDEDYEMYLKLADKALATPMQDIDHVNTRLLDGLENDMKREAMLTRESRRIVDREELKTDALIRAYLLTKNRKYADEGLKRVKKMISWSGSDKLAGDFNEATFARLGSLAYDACYDIMDEDSKRYLLDNLAEVRPYHVCSLQQSSGESHCRQSCVADDFQDIHDAVVHRLWRSARSGYMGRLLL